MAACCKGLEDLHGRLPDMSAQLHNKVQQLEEVCMLQFCHLIPASA
jgi:hypothetical protein